MNEVALLESLEQLLKDYMPSSSIKQILLAYHFAEKAHFDQKRKSGEKFIIHPLHVAIEIANLRLDESSVIAALLHDTVEDTNTTIETIDQEFGEEVGKLVMGLTKISDIAKNAEKSGEDFEPVRKFLIAAAEDIRVVIIKLADRLHNMQTVKFLSEEKQYEYARETQKIYAPLAEYIGIGKFKSELEDLSFEITNPREYRDITEELNEDKDTRNKYVEEVSNTLKGMLNKEKIKADVFGRSKSISSIYSKIIRREGAFDKKYLSDMSDLNAISILVDEVLDCYRILGLVHQHWSHIPKKFDDYIANPKPNGFRALQTTVRSLNGKLVEIQIKTYVMHEYNEFGPASHIAYKRSGKYYASKSEEYSWVKNLMIWKNNNDSKSDYNLNIFRNSIFVLTPKGAVKELPVGSTPIDFAYRIHSIVGDTCRGAKVNNKLVPLDTKLNNGDIVEILSEKSARFPNEEWLDFVVTSYAKDHIRKMFRAKQKEEEVRLSKTKVDKATVLKVYIEAEDRIGMLKDLSKVISKEVLNMRRIRTTTNRDDIAGIYIDIDLKHGANIEHLLESLRRIKGVISIKTLT